MPVFPETLPIPDAVLEIAGTLEDAGFETWCVGGAVRDNLLDFDNSDFDLATSATPDQVRELFRRTVPIGVAHGTIGVLDRNRRPHEVTTFRKDVKTDGRHAVVEFGVSLEEDLARRDFTINAIAYHPTRQKWVDLFGGQADLEAKVIRAVGDPAQRFREDYLRILRALRFAARFGFEIEQETWAAAVANADGLEHLSAERVRDEWVRGLKGAEKPSRLVELWEAVGALTKWLPETGSVDPEVVDRFGERDPVLITSLLSGDPSRTLKRLRCSSAEIERGRRIGEYRGQEPQATDVVEVRRWMSRVGPAVDDLLKIVSAEQRGGGGSLATAVADVQASKAPLTVSDLAVDGNDLLEIGIEPGPELGRLLGSLLDQVIVDPKLNTKAQLLNRVQVHPTAPSSPLPPPSSLGSGE